jgi:DNA-binding transcriptional MerR regulator
MAETFSIGAVARRTGIPVTTLRFYERELPGLFPIRKTSGGHRRYDGRDISRFETVRKLTAEGLALGELRQALSARAAGATSEDALDRLSQRLESGAAALADLLQRVERLETRLQELEGRPPRKGGWFGKK